jgi:hypothetical protein
MKYDKDLETKLLFLDTLLKFYDITDIPQIKYCQIGGTVYFAHEKHPLTKIETNARVIEVEIVKNLGVNDDN